jgi:hypothetical protein
VGHVASFTEPLLADLPTPEAVVSSDQGFANFLIVANGWYSDQQFGPRLDIPCAAFVRRPGLIVVLGSRFSPSSDCMAMLPPTPKLDRLVAAALRAQPPCGGSIIRDLGAVYNEGLIENRLNISSRPVGAGESYSISNNIDSRERQFRARYAGKIRGSIEELRNYYSVEFNLVPSISQAKARRAVDFAVSGAFHLCE